MVTVTSDLRDYLERTLGVRVELAPAKLGRLPVYLAHAYRTWRTRLFGHEFLLAEARPGDEHTRRRLAADVEALRRIAPDQYVAIVLPHVGRTQRHRLVAAGIPFIVPDSQMFLPNALIDLQERFPRAKAERPTRLSAAAQLVVLRQLLRRDVEGEPLVAVARACGYSAMTLTNVREELIAAGLCRVLEGARTKPLRFEAAGRELWEKALPALRTPVKRTVTLGVLTRELRVFDAGLTALARRTMIGEPHVRTVAADGKALRHALAQRLVLPGATEDEPAIEVQEWVYDPHRLGDEFVVDPLSLWLSLRGDTDERVRAALDELLRTVSW